MTDENAIGTRVRRLRRRMGWTLETLGERCGFTRSLLSKIETGKTVPPVATLTRIAKALGVTVGSLLDDDDRVGTVVEKAPTRKADRLRRMTATEKGYRFFGFAAGRSRKLMQPLLFEAERGAIRPQPMSHGGEEFVYVLRGKMRYRVGETQYTLGPGDSVYFDAEQEHELEPISEQVQFLAVFAEAGKRG